MKPVVQTKNLGEFTVVVFKPFNLPLQIRKKEDDAG